MTRKKETQSSKTASANKPAKKKDRIAIIRIRGLTGLRKEVKDTFKMLNLNSKFSCAVIPKNDSYVGMIKKVKDFATWGEIDSATLKNLKDKREEKDKKTYRLHPPRGGFERKGTKKAFNQGGALGYRKEKINELLMRMV